VLEAGSNKVNPKVFGENRLIVICGDLLHSKSSLSP
jgi:hypothetical protein